MFMAEQPNAVNAAGDNFCIFKLGESAFGVVKGGVYRRLGESLVHGKYHPLGPSSLSEVVVRDSDFFGSLHPPERQAFFSGFLCSAEQMMCVCEHDVVPRILSGRGAGISHPRRRLLQPVAPQFSRRALPGV